MSNEDARPPGPEDEGQGELQPQDEPEARPASGRRLLRTCQVILSAATIPVGAGLILTAIAAVEQSDAGTLTGLAFVLAGFALATTAAGVIRMIRTAAGCAAMALLTLLGITFIVLTSPQATPELLPADTEVVLILDTAAIRQARDEFPGDYQDFLDGLQEELTSSLSTIEIDAVSTDLYLLVSLEGEDHALAIAKGGLIPSYIADDWDARLLTADSYRGRPVWDQGRRRHTLLPDHDAVAASPSRGAVNTLLRTAEGDLPTLTDTGDAPLKILLDVVGMSPARGAATGGSLADLCLLPLPGCEGFALAYDSFDAENAETKARAAVLFTNPRRAQKALDQYDATEAFLKAAVRLLAQAANSDFGLLPPGTITVNSLERDGPLLLAFITVQEDEYGHGQAKGIPAHSHPMPTGPATTCDGILKRELLLQRDADTAPDMNRILNAIQEREDICDAAAWDPAVLTAPLPALPDQWVPGSPQDLCFDQQPNDNGDYTVDGITVPETLTGMQDTANGKPQIYPLYQSTRDRNDNLLVYFSPENPPGDLAHCWMYLNRDQLWVADYRD